MGNTLGRSKLTVTLLGLGLLVLGLAVLLNPIGALEDGVSLMGWILVIVGALTLLAAVIQDGLPPRHGWADLAVGVLEVVPGIAMVVAPAALVNVVWDILGVYVILSGVHAILDGTSTAGRVCGAIVCALGVSVMAASLQGPVFGMLMACPVLVVDGVIQLVLGLRRGEAGAAGGRRGDRRHKG